jgi:hypothetical protein
MTEKRAKIYSVLMDTLLTALFGACLSVVVFPSMIKTTPSFPMLILLSLPAAIVILLLTRKVYIIPSIFAAFLIVFLYYYVSGRMSLLQNVFFAWIRDNVLNTSTPKSALLYLLYFIVFLGINLVLFIFYRRFHLFIVIFATSAFLIIWAFFSGQDHFFLMTTIVLFVVMVSLSKSRSKAHARLLSEDRNISGAYHTLTAGLLTIVILASSFLVAPKEDGRWQSDFLVRVTRDFAALMQLEGERMPQQGLFNISGYGYQPLGSRLGGNVTLNHSIVMNVFTETPISLSGNYYSVYDGASWTDYSPITQYRYNGLLLRGERDDAFLEKLPSGGNESEIILEKMTTSSVFRIYSRIYGRTIFQIGQNPIIYDANFDDELIFFNSQAELFLDGTARRGINYKLKTEYIDRKSPFFEENMLELESIIEGEKDPYYESIQQKYLQLPESLPQDVNNQALEITSGIDSPYLKAVAIETWLSENCIYTLEPGDPPKDRDFVSYFLETREGYCVYFSTAMAVLARANGLPARYVTGLALHRSPNERDSSHFVATNASAHAWCEIYFKGIGWVRFDPSGRSAQQYYDTGVDPDIIEGPVTARTSPSPTPFDDSEITPSPEKKISQAPRALTDSSALLGIALSVLFIIVIATRTTRLLRNLTFLKNRFFTKHLTPEEQCQVMFSRSERQIRLLGYPLKPEETLSEYLKRNEKIIALQGLPQSWDVYIRMTYGQQTPSESEIQEFYQLGFMLERQILANRGIIYYVLIRSLLRY